MTDQSQSLDTILGRNGAEAEAKTEPEAKPVEQSTAAPTDDDPDPQPEDIGGRKMVPLEAVQAERGKAKRYTEQVAAFEKRFTDQQKSFDDYQKASDRRYADLVAALQRPPAQQQPQNQPQAPDFFQDPEAAINAALERALTPIAKHVTTMSDATSRRFAVAESGKDTVNAAYQAMEDWLRADPHAVGEYRRIMSSADPWGELVTWHKRESAVAEMGTDPAAFTEKVTAKILADLEAAGRLLPAANGQTNGQPPLQQQQPQSAPVMPSNLAGARNAGPRSGPAWAGPSPLTDIFERRNALLTRSN